MLCKLILIKTHCSFLPNIRLKQIRNETNSFTFPYSIRSYEMENLTVTKFALDRNITENVSQQLIYKLSIIAKYDNFVTLYKHRFK